MRARVWASAAGAIVAATAPASAHHSSVMYDETRVETVQGTIAKVEWSNPHILIWTYVRDEKSATGYRLYAFQSGSVNLLMRNGWTRDTLPSGEKVTIDFFPLKDGRPGGSLVKVIHADGSVSSGDPLALSLARLLYGAPRGASADGAAPATASGSSGAGK